MRLRHARQQEDLIEKQKQQMMEHQKREDEQELSEKGIDSAAATDTGAASIAKKAARATSRSNSNNDEIPTPKQSLKFVISKRGANIRRIRGETDMRIGPSHETKRRKRKYATKESNVLG